MKFNLIYVLACLFVVVLTSCASLNAPYEAFDESRRLGYQDQKLSSNTWVVKFYANLFTEPTDIVLLAQLRGVEICQKQGKALTHFLKMEDQTPAKNIQTAEGFYKFVPPYLKNDVSTQNAGNQFGISSGSNDPVYEVTFACVDQAYSAQILLREVAAEDAKNIVSDLRGVVQVDGFDAETLNGKNLQADDFIVKANGVRVKNKVDLYRALDEASNGSVKLTVSRDRKPVEVDAQLTNISASVKAFGQKVVQTACRKEDMKSVSICIH